MELSFDPLKNERNVAERSLSFEMVQNFNFKFAQILEDTRKPYPERRFRAQGWIQKRLYALVFTPTADGIRVISFRKANAREERIYAQNA